MKTIAIALITAAGLLMPNIVRADSDIQKQIDDALAAGKNELTIQPGEYRLPVKPHRPQLLLKGVKDFTLIGEGVTVIAGSLDQALKLEDCQNVEIRGLTIDYDPLPFTQGVVVDMAEDNTWADVKIDAGYPAAVEDKGRRAIVYDADTRQVKPGAWSRHGVTVSPKEDGVARLSWGRPMVDTITVGDPISLTQKTITPHGLFLERSSNCTLRNVTLHSSTSFGFFEVHGGGNKYLGCKINPGPPPAGATAPRLLATVADAFHSKHTTQGPTVEDCVFDTMGDDGIAINGQYVLVVSGEGNKLILSPQREMPFYVGDRVHGVSTTGQPTEDVKVVSINPIPEDQAVDAKAIQEKHYPEMRLAGDFFKKSFEVILDSPLAVKEGDLIASPDRNGSGFVVRNNILWNTRARGVLIKASYGVIEGNTVEHASLAGIVLCPETRFWQEADYSKNVVIRNNTVRDVGIGAINPGMIQAGAITICAEGDGKKPGPAGGHRDIVIEGNRVENANGVNLMITSASDLAVLNNTFVNPHPVKGGSGGSYGVDPTAVIWITESSDITLKGNKVENPGPHSGKMVVTTESAVDVNVVD